jgi:hypothetical protein
MGRDGEGGRESVARLHGGGNAAGGAAGVAGTLLARRGRSLRGRRGKAHLGWCTSLTAPPIVSWRSCLPSVLKS